MNKLKAFLVCVSVAFSGRALADESGVKAHLRLLAYSGEIETPEVFLHDPAAEPDAVPVQYEIRGFLNGDFINVPLKSRKVVFTSAKERDSMTKEDQLLGEAALPADCDSAIILFLPTKETGKGKYKTLVVADSIKAFPPGSFQFSNLSETKFKLQLEDQSFEFGPGDSGLLQNLPSRANKEMGMRAYLFKNDEWKEFSSSIWSHPGEARSFMILVDEPESTNPRFRSFDDVKPAKVVEPAPAPAKKKGKKSKKK